jgi:hypothetical protein
MPDQSPQSNSPPPSSPFFSTWGPLDGPIFGNNISGADDVLADGETMRSGSPTPRGGRAPSGSGSDVLVGRQQDRAAWVLALQRAEVRPDGRRDRGAVMVP